MNPALHVAWLTRRRLLQVGGIGILGLGLWFIVVGAVAYAFGEQGKRDANRRAIIFLVAIGLTFFAICAARAAWTRSA